jgi:protocatechuate 3,4-dioxygenase beta subunit
MKKRFIIGLVACMACTIASIGTFGLIGMKTYLMAASAKNPETNCQPTSEDYLGPFYKAGAPVRSSVGKGYELTGLVMSAANCAPIPQASIELWLVNPDGSYDDEHRATIFANKTGEYRFESNFPSGYSGRPPHIHMRISAKGFKTLVTQHYPADDQTTGEFDIVLVPSE